MNNNLTFKEMLKKTIMVNYSIGNFTLKDMYSHRDEYQSQFPNRLTLEAGVRGTLQTLRDEGFIEFVDYAGTYRFIGSGDITKLKINYQKLNIGLTYSKKEIEEIFDTNFGHSISGINLRNLSDGTKAILLFSSVKGPYSDRSEEDIIIYSGEGIEGDQKLTTANKALINSNSDGRIIFGFEKIDPKSTEWVYMGLLKVFDYDYVSKNGRKHYEFKILKLQFETPEIILKEQEDLINEAITSEPVLTEIRDTKKTFRKIKVRSAAFKTKVKELYDDSCAVCGIKRYNKAKNPEVEAAHIFPVEKDGTDDLRNGLSLCKLHHWAFDGGLFVIEDSYEIRVLPNILNDRNYEEIYKFDGKKINLPKNKEITPNKLYLSEHRKIHNFS